MNRFFTLCAALFWAALSTAQSWEDVKNNQEYLWGDGYGSSVTEADRNALSDLISRISVHVSNSVEILDEEKRDGEKIDSKSYVTNRLKTYSQATLNNTERIILSNEPNAHVGRWIKKTEISKMFERRVVKAKDLVENALRAETMGKVDDALRNYYWAYALVRSVQHPSDVTYTTEDGKTHVIINWIKEQMNTLFDNVHITVTNRNNDDVFLSITYKDKRVASLDYTFFDGRDWSNLYSAKDGIGVLELAKGNSNENYQIKLEYEYLGEAQIDKEIESVLGVVKSVSMRKSYKTVEAIGSRTGEPIELRANQFFSKTTADMAVMPKEITDNKKVAQTLNEIISTIISKKYDAPSSLFTPNGYDVYMKLLKYGTAKVIGNPLPTFYDSFDGITARGIKMSFSFKTGMRKAFVEDVIFYFDKTGKVNNITFGLGDAAEMDVLYKGAWSESARKSIMEFLENYKTAYALKRLDYIETIFDDDAIIIVANVASRMSTNKELNAGSTIGNNQVIRHNRYTKDQYLKNLKRCFAGNEFINIRFANNDVVKLGKGGETYAIQISQDYYSSSYGDKGYLFLMVDINDPKHPLIRLRTWQAEKDPNFGLYGPGDFK